MLVHLHTLSSVIPRFTSPPVHLLLLRRVFFFQAEDGIRYLVRSRGLGDVYKRQDHPRADDDHSHLRPPEAVLPSHRPLSTHATPGKYCLLYTSDAADERSSVDLGGRRIIKQKTRREEW